MRYVPRIDKELNKEKLILQQLHTLIESNATIPDELKKSLVEYEKFQNAFLFLESEFSINTTKDFEERLTRYHKIGTPCSLRMLYVAMLLSYLACTLYDNVVTTSLNTAFNLAKFGGTEGDISNKDPLPWGEGFQKIAEDGYLENTFIFSTRNYLELKKYNNKKQLCDYLSSVLRRGIHPNKVAVFKDENYLNSFDDAEIIYFSYGTFIDKRNNNVIITDNYLHKSLLIQFSSYYSSAENRYVFNENKEVIASLFKILTYILKQYEDDLDKINDLTMKQIKAFASFITHTTKYDPEKLDFIRQGIIVFKNNLDAIQYKFIRLTMEIPDVAGIIFNETYKNLYLAHVEGRLKKIEEDVEEHTKILEELLNTKYELVIKKNSFRDFSDHKGLFKYIEYYKKINLIESAAFTVDKPNASCLLLKITTKPYPIVFYDNGVLERCLSWWSVNPTLKNELELVCKGQRKVWCTPLEITVPLNVMEGTFDTVKYMHIKAGGIQHNTIQTRINWHLSYNCFGTFKPELTQALINLDLTKFLVLFMQFLQTCAPADTAGQRIFISSPLITDLEDNITYCEDFEFAIHDDPDKKVYLKGKNIFEIWRY